MNLHRRHLTDDQRDAISMQTLPLLEAEARKRRAEGGKGGSQRVGENAKPSPLHSRTAAAEQFKVSEYVQGAAGQGADGGRP
jgi:hypothetical protein